MQSAPRGRNGGRRGVAGGRLEGGAEWEKQEAGGRK